MGDTVTVDREPRADPASRGVGRRRHRSVATTQQKVVIAVVAVLGGFAAAFADAAPTGTGSIDGVYRVAFVVGLSVIGSRARRWSLVAAGALVSVGSLGIVLAVGLVALALSVLLVVKDLRDRVWGAAIGSLVGYCSLGLSAGGFAGSSTVIGLAAAGCIVASGYDNSTKSTRRLLLRAAGGVAALTIVATSLAGVLALRSQSSVSDGVNLTSKGITLVQAGKTSEAAESFRRASLGFSAVVRDADAWWAFPARLLPGVSQNANVVRVVSLAGERLARAAQRTSAEVDYELIRRPGGGIDLERLEQFSGPVRATARELEAAAAAVKELDSPWLVGPLQDRLKLFRTKVAGLTDDAQLAALAVDRAPALLGRDTPRRYLVLLGNPAEARDLGGHIGNWAELEVSEGIIKLVRVGRPLELSRPSGEPALNESKAYPESVLGLLPATYPQNWGASLDFPTDARLAAQLFEEATGTPVDGVMYADPYVLAAMLDITGPVPVPGLNRQLSGDQAVRFLTLDQFVEYRDPNQGDEAVTQLVKDLFEKFTSARLPGPDKLGALFGPVTRSGRLRFVSTHAEDDALLGRLGLSYALPQGDDESDFLAVVQRNANPSKIDSFLHRDTSIEVRWNPTTGETRSTIRVSLRNDSPSEGLPAYVIGNGNGLPKGTNTFDLAVLAPSKELESITVNGSADVFASTTDEGSVYRHETRLQLAPGATSVVEFVISDQREPSKRYSLFYAGQPTVNPGSTEVLVRATGRRPIPGKGIAVIGDTATSTQRDSENTRISLRVI